MAKGTKIGELFFDIRAGIESLQKDIASGKSVIKKFESDVKQTFKTITGALALGAAVAAPIYAIKKLGDALGDLAEKGDRAGDIADNFKALGGASSSIDEAKKAVLGTVSAFDLMKVANEGLMRTIPGFNENFGKMADFAKRFAEATGQDTAQVLEQFTNALATGKTKGLEPFGFALDSTATKAERQKQVFEQLQSRIEGLAKPMDSVAEAQAALGVSMDDMWARMGIGVNNNTNLTIAFRKLNEVIDNADFADFGNDLATIYSWFINLAADAIPPVITLVNKLAAAFEYMTQSSMEGVIAGFQEKKSALEKELADIKANPTKGLDTAFGGGFSDSLREEQIKREIEDLQRNINNGMKIRQTDMANREKLETDSAKKTAAVRQQIEEERANADLKLTKDTAAKKAKAELEAKQKAYQQFLKEVEKFDKQNLEKSIENSIAAGDKEGFQLLVEKYKEETYQSVIDANKDAYSQGGEIQAAVEAHARRVADATGESLEQKLKEANAAGADNLKQEYAAAFDALSNSLGDLADSFGVDLSGVINTVSSLLSEESKAKIMEGIAGGLNDIFGTSLSGSDVAAYGQAVTTTLGSIINAHDKNKATKSEAGTGGAVGAGGGAIIGSFFGPEGAAIGAEIGKVAGEIIGGMIKHGPQNAESKARHEFANQIEDMIHSLKTSGAFGVTGKFGVSNAEKYNFLEGSTSKFNDGKAFDEMKKWGATAEGVFLGLGEALKGVMGITEDVGAQMGLILGENLGGDIDKARLAVIELGLSFEDLSEALLKSALKGSISWQQYANDIAGIQEAFKPGLVAVGDFQGAWNEFIASAGRGQAALKGARDIGVEALESGAKTFEQAKQQLIAAGSDPEQVNAFFDAIEKRGIKTLEQLSKAEDAVLGGAIGDTANASASLSKLWGDAYDAVMKYSDALNALPEEKTIRLRFETELDDNTQTAIDSGLTNQAGVTIPTTANTPETNSTTTPRTTARAMRGSSSSTNNMTLNMDLRGASAGVGAEVERAVRRMEDRIVRNAVSATAKTRRRGGALSRDLGA